MEVAGRHTASRSVQHDSLVMTQPLADEIIVARLDTSLKPFPLPSEAVEGFRWWRVGDAVACMCLSHLPRTLHVFRVRV